MSLLILVSIMLVSCAPKPVQECGKFTYEWDSEKYPSIPENELLQYPQISCFMNALRTCEKANIDIDIYQKQLPLPEGIKDQPPEVQELLKPKPIRLAIYEEILGGKPEKCRVYFLVDSLWPFPEKDTKGKDLTCEINVQDKTILSTLNPQEFKESCQGSLLGVI